MSLRRIQETFLRQLKKHDKVKSYESCKVSFITIKSVIHAKAGIQKKTGFRIKPGMTNRIRLLSAV